MPQRVPGLLHDLRGHFGHIAFADLGHKVPLVRRAQNGASEFGDAHCLLRCQHHVIPWRQHAFKAIAKAHHLPAACGGGTDDAVDDCIETGAIPAAV